MKSPIVSVVMSVFNGQEFLSDAVDSILNQTFRDFEFVIIDDGSTDSTPEIISSYSSRDSRIRIHRHDNKGRAESLNVGINLATGNYIARMDADDIALPLRLSQQIGFMERHPEVGLLGGAIQLINMERQVIDTVRPPLEDSEIRSAMLRYNPFHPAVVMRKEIVRTAGGYRRVLVDADDYDVYLRIGERSRLANLDKPILQYRIHPHQASVLNMRHQAICTLAARAAASLRRQGSPDPLSNLAEVTPQFVETLGVSGAQIQELLVEGCTYWIRVLRQSDPDAALRIIHELSNLSRSGNIKRSVLSNASLTAAGIHYRRGRLARAIVSAGRGVMLRPKVAVRPIRGVLVRFRALFRKAPR